MSRVPHSAEPASPVPGVKRPVFFLGAATALAAMAAILALRPQAGPSDRES